MNCNIILFWYFIFLKHILMEDKNIQTSHNRMEQMVTILTIHKLMTERRESPLLLDIF